MKTINPYPIFSLALVVLMQVPQTGATQSATATADRTNIILCMTDDQGWGDVSYNGLKQIQTPLSPRR